MFPGTYAVDARVVVQHRLRREPFIGPFKIGLLTSPPKPEGTHAVELDAPGYSRTEIEFGPPAVGAPNAARRNARRVSLGPIGHDAARAQWAAIFDCEGGVLAYGRVQTCAGDIDPAEIAFDGGTIRLRF